MPGISRETLTGYVLEEVIAALIKNTGYRLLVDPTQDPDALRAAGNGLTVVGRGGRHQVDVLGELAWIPAFTYPLRLIVEAKAGGQKCGIGVVRNAVGVVSDVNQRLYSRGHGIKQPVQHFSYRYALFSTAGFSAPAAEYALAHQISLVDLSAPAFADVRRLATDIADAVTDHAASGPRRADGFIARLRSELRATLETWPIGVPHPDPDPGGGVLPESARRRAAASAYELGELFVAMANGPFLLLLKADDPQTALKMLSARPVQTVRISWYEGDNDVPRWRIDIDDSVRSTALHFGIPEAVADWIFAPDANPARRALQFKQEFLSTLTVYRFVDGRDHLYRLSYDPGPADRPGRPHA